MQQERKAPVLTESQFKQVVAAARTHGESERNVALLYFSFALGLRAKELSQLLIRDVVNPDGKIRDQVLLTRAATKGQKQRLVYLTNRDVRKALATYLHARQDKNALPPSPTSPVFLSRKGGAFSPNTMQMLFKRMYCWAGFDHASSHSGRRTFATSLIERGVDIKAVSSLMGHSSVAMTARYVDDNPIRLRRICEAVSVGV
jgi:integrase/recombinase XerD